jgi:hypothetical protein
MGWSFPATVKKVMGNGYRVEYDAGAIAVIDGHPANAGQDRVSSHLLHWAYRIILLVHPDP